MKKKLITAATALVFVTGLLAQREKQADAVTLPLDSFTAKISRQSTPQVIDARSPEEFAFNHIEHALNFNVQSPGYEEQIKKLDKSQPVFIYAINTGRSSVLAQDLRKRGFTAAWDLEGGIANWIGSGRPYVSSIKKGLTPAAYQQLVGVDKTILVAIGSRYCPACKKAKLVLDTVRAGHPQDLEILSIELEENPQLIASLKTVDVFPYFILYNKGGIVYKRSGLNALKEDLEKALAALK